MRFRFSIRLCLLVMLFLGFVLAKAVNDLDVVMRGNQAIKNIAPEFPDEINWGIDIQHSPCLTSAVGSGSVVYHAEKTPWWMTTLSKYSGSKTNLQVTGLSISVPEFDDDDFKSILEIRTLKKLAFELSSVSDRGLNQLGQLKSLEEVFIERFSNPNITEAGINELRENLPNCTVSTKRHPLIPYPVW